MAQQIISDPHHQTGWKPDEPDSRDFVFASLFVSGGVNPPEPDKPYETLLWKPKILEQPTLDLKDLSTNSPGVYDQGDRMQSCVANAVAMAACYAWHKRPGEDQDRISGSEDKLFDPSPIHQYGCPPNSVWPYPQLTAGDYPDVPWGVLQEALKMNPDGSMFNVAKQHFINDFEYYSIKTIGLDDSWQWQGDVEPPPEASDRVIQMRSALAEGYPIVFAIGEWDINDTQDPRSTKWNRWWAPMWEASNFTVGNIEGGTSGYDVIMNDLDPGFFPTNNPRLAIGTRHNGHVMIVIGSDAKRELFLVQNSYGLYNDMNKNIQKKPYFWMPYNYFRTRLVDATWVIRIKDSTVPPPNSNPSSYSVTITFSDNFSGANVSKEVAANAGPQIITEVLAATSVAAQGGFTSIQLKAVKPTTIVTVKKDDKILGTARASGNDYAQWTRTALNGVTIEVTA